MSTMEECWDHDSEARLTAACVVERLSSHTTAQDSPHDALNAANNAANVALNATNKSAQPRHLLPLPQNNHLKNNVMNIGTNIANNNLKSNNGGINNSHYINSPNSGNNININRVPSHVGDHNNDASNIHGLNLHNPSLRYGNGSNSSNSSGSNNSSSSGSYSSNFSVSSSPGGSRNGVVVSPLTALSNHIPRTVTTGKPMLPPTVNVPLPHSSSGASVNRLYSSSGSGSAGPSSSNNSSSSCNIPPLRPAQLQHNQPTPMSVVLNSVVPQRAYMENPSNALQHAQSIQVRQQQMQSQSASTDSDSQRPTASLVKVVVKTNDSLSTKPTNSQCHPAPV